MSHFTIGTFFASTATALAPFLIVYYMPQKVQKTQTPSSALATLPKPRPLAALRDARENAKTAPEFNLL
ncbi:uncharacterized protein PV07_00835 [Cladophialophora immunda]|uniref:Uncharacterized protein n=1 Tax=Cladophialophora immunda TaxID=569365 RepID=A0A0D2CS93_9EURO|nr:uncharacterized protein PV07_00835 [Cladophialophora immunda]KIW34033.1 hypothetical protein PV07_00835 [Cladophialophora immunda]OQV03100.1 hypothetical protein CLAIMM_08192 [Cladophialophora immunda]